MARELQQEVAVEATAPALAKAISSLKEKLARLENGRVSAAA